MLESYSLKEIQTKTKDIIVDLDSFFAKHEIKYFLMGGSALGAIRHKGFIPWDDDLDIFIPYKDYLRFKDLTSDKLPSKYFFQEEMKDGWGNLFSKIKVNGTTYFEGDTIDLDIHHGFFVDVMPLINVSNNFLIRFKQFTYAKLLVAKGLLENGYKTNSRFKRIILWFSDKWINQRREKRYLKYVLKNNNKKTKYVAHFFGRAKYKNSIYKSDWFEKQIYVPFEDVSLPVMNGYGLYLEKRYGKEYMKMPSQKTKDKYPSHLLYANPNVDYREINIEHVKKLKNKEY